MTDLVNHYLTIQKAGRKVKDLESNNDAKPSKRGE